MKVIIGGLYHESNTFNPFPTNADDFVLVEGIEVFERVCSTNVFQEAGITVIPTIYATALSSGVVTEKAYRFFADKMLHVIKNEANIDGIWLHLHGAMTVENIGSGELQLLKEIREIVGSEIPISLTLDIHGNNAIELKDYANIIRAYRTVPHTDQCETEIITAELLIDVIKTKQTVFPAYVQIPMIIGGEQALGNREPLKSIFDKLREIEKIEGVATASFFIGFSWADTIDSAASVIVVPKTEKDAAIAGKQANILAEYVYSRRNDFQFDAIALPPKDAINKAIEQETGPVFISDSGDNTTGGGVGIYTGLLRSILYLDDLNSKKICISAIFDAEAYVKCTEYDIGDTVSIDVGINYDKDSASVTVNGVLKAKGKLLGYLGGTSDHVGNTCTVSVGDIDVVIANKGHSFITVDHFKAAGLNIQDYDVIVVKQGYLFPELSEISTLDLLALTPGATYQLLEELEFKTIQRPMFPLDK